MLVMLGVGCCFAVSSSTFAEDMEHGAKMERDKVSCTVGFDSAKTWITCNSFFSTTFLLESSIFLDRALERNAKKKHTSASI